MKRKIIAINIYNTNTSITKEQTEICSICRESMVDNKITIICNHVFHTNCFVKWVKIDNSCPLCRFRKPITGEMIEKLESHIARIKKEKAAIERAESMFGNCIIS